MLSVMTLALAHSHAVPAFNGLYYATIATVIPVLFLAIAIQGNLFRDLIEASARSAENSRARGRYRTAHCSCYPYVASSSSMAGPER